MTNQQNHIKNLVLSALCLAIAMYLPFLTGQIQTIGNMLCPMHIPVFFVRLYVRMEMGRSSRLCLAVHQIFRLRYASYNAGRNRYGF